MADVTKTEKKIPEPAAAPADEREPCSRSRGWSSTSRSRRVCCSARSARCRPSTG
ncbi:hypothetical protein ACFQZC_13510 [Streptacidiphilus monticola]